MARVEIARDAGACFGVERALKLVQDTLRDTEGAVCTLGPLIHNPRVVADLSAAGASVVEEPAACPAGATLVLRTHGSAPATEHEAAALGLKVIDATCPFVKKVHRAVQKLEDEGYQVVVVGEKGHPEVEGTLGHTRAALVVGTAAELDRCELGRRVGVVAQTTLALGAFAEVVSALVGRCEEVRAINTICEATSRRQQAASELAARADTMVVIGGRNSANTTHLADICRQICPRTYHIESEEEVDAGWFEGARTVGITAGASTPAAHIDAVRMRVEELVGQ